MVIDCIASETEKAKAEKQNKREGISTFPLTEQDLQDNKTQIGI